MGLNASSPENGVCVCTDQEYMEVANDALQKSKFGFFCIPGIARLEDLKIARDNGASFVRVGINANEIPKTEAYIHEAKDLGLIVMTNYMKSYVLTPEDFAKNVLLSEKYGADYVYLVDSAGSMLPEDIEKYYNAIRQISDIKLGFHGHNNLGLAVSNSVFCSELGFDLVDSSLQGLGRSSGNASTELLCAVLMKKGLINGIDIVDLFTAGYELLHPITSKNMTNPLDYICGYAGFHTSYMKYIQKCSTAFHVNPLALILAYAAIDQVNMDYNKLCEISKTLPTDLTNHKYNFSEYIGTEQMVK